MASFANAGAAQVFINASRHRRMNQVVNFVVDALARNENLFEERKVAIVIVDFTFDQSADLIARAWDW